MKNKLGILLSLVSFFTASATTFNIHVSEMNVGTSEVGKNIKCSKIGEAFSFINRCKENANFNVILYDKYYVVESGLKLKDSKNIIKIYSKRGLSAITSGGVLKNAYVNGDTIIFSVNSQFRKLLVNGKNIPLSTTFDSPREFHHYSDIRQIDKRIYAAKFDKEDVSKMELGCDLVFYTRWRSYKVKVISINEDTGEVKFDTFGNLFQFVSDKEACFTILNSRKLLRPGSFCCINGKIYYLKNKGEDMNNLEFRVPHVPTLLSLEGCDNVTFSGITFRDATMEQWYLYEVQGATFSSSCVDVKGSSNIIFKDCVFTNNLGYSISINSNSSNCKIEGCRFENLQGGGIILGFTDNDNTNHITINDNLIKTYGTINVCSEGILCARAHDVNITNNTICNGYYTGITLGWTWGYGKSYSYNNYVANNHLHHLMRGVLSDGGGIYTLGKQNGTIIENNYLHDIISYKDGDALGIYTDEGSSNIIIRNNVCFGTNTAFHEHFGKCNTIENNVWAFSNYYGMHLSNAQKDSSLVARGNVVIMDVGSAFNETFANNALLHSNRNAMGVELNNITGIKKDYYAHPKNIRNFMSVASLYRSGLLKKKFNYGVKTKRLKKVASLPEEIDETDKKFVKEKYKQVSNYFKQ